VIQEKNDLKVRMSEVEIRKKLMSELLTSVQQCQVRYGGKSELATESEEVLIFISNDIRKRLITICLMIN
jgi:hypothetical protein